MQDIAVSECNLPCCSDSLQAPQNICSITYFFRLRRIRTGAGILLHVKNNVTTTLLTN